MKITSVEFTTSAVRRSQYPEEKYPEFLLVGRSNVGKSSFINALVNRKSLARISSIPGKTQTLNFYFINESFFAFSKFPFLLALLSLTLMDAMFNSLLFFIKIPLNALNIHHLLIFVKYCRFTDVVN